jgi:hypothetical protein
MTNQTEACKKIIKNIEAALVGTFDSRIMIQNILSVAQGMADEGYVWDVALAKSCQIYPATRYCAEGTW